MSREFLKSEMEDGYYDGLCDNRIDLPESSNRTAAYRHGWLNGRDDRTHSPRAFASVLRETAERTLNGGEA